eukprot:TRINITY_DN3615_c0_g1_i1.p4 TRINITY_DN3615_c0_g1~~TRINITY_DN3615_c0_g1_i1.p4  ORF type:complete len:237 (+),score=46.09 TRINITY_DN3615_c0_g1_i1:253-963(+)
MMLAWPRGVSIARSAPANFFARSHALGRDAVRLGTRHTSRSVHALPPACARSTQNVWRGTRLAAAQHTTRSLLAGKHQATSVLSPVLLGGARPALRALATEATQPATVDALKSGAKSGAIRWWYATTTGLVFGIVVLGGVTRLTESGLSMVTWKPLGSLPPSSPDEWLEEFERYKAFPEYKLLNHSMTLDEFKRIFFFEYAHRMWGRAIGAAWALPLAYFALRKKLTGQSQWNFWA